MLTKLKTELSVAKAQNHIGGGGGNAGCGWVGGKIIKPLCGSILQAGTCQTLSLAENPIDGAESRVWQY